MLAVDLLTPWKEKDRHWASLCEDYQQRLSKKWRFREMQPTKKGAFWPPGAFRIAVTERGEQVTSPELAKRLERWVMQRDKVVLTIGSAYGLTPEIEQSADWQWSLGKLVLPHQLARLVVLEQLYRAATILAGEPYHHA
jgi:23S rRNA (pseudouridine1915-N3)-methyltransferase